MSHPKYKPGDAVVYRKTKFSNHPGPRAKAVEPAAHGDDYNYEVDKFWVVVKTADDGKVVARTRRGKTHMIDPDDPNLRPAHWWERWLYGDRFPKLTDDATVG
jgi:hypothetical protein